MQMLNYVKDLMRTNNNKCSCKIVTSLLQLAVLMAISGLNVLFLWIVWYVQCVHATNWFHGNWVAVICAQTRFHLAESRSITEHSMHCVVLCITSQCCHCAFSIPLRWMRYDWKNMHKNQKKRHIHAFAHFAMLKFVGENATQHNTTQNTIWCHHELFYAEKYHVLVSRVCISVNQAVLIELLTFSFCSTFLRKLFASIHIFCEVSACVRQKLEFFTFSNKWQ